ncbi:glutathione S-transferase family protein [Mastigocladopsis repens]|uniref:glutathione S-transferase family protein n=1 Tax=Mastigocladopsis repens TaxID=221287 RepID=UPI000311412C|nr:glutathione S-transferase family protein [Mastigocladopsis repens]
MRKLYDFTLSGNCHKVRLMLSILNLEYESILVHLREFEQKSPEYLKLNPLGQVPVLVDGDTVIRDAQAILVYLARHYSKEDWLPTEAEAMSKVMQWLFTAACDIQQGIVATRAYHLFGRQVDIELATQKAHDTLKSINEHLVGKQWLELERPSIADIACFPYIGLVGDAKISLLDYPNVAAWIERVKQLPGYVGMPGL